MKTKMLICFVLLFISLGSIAQIKTRGFYLNPNLQFEPNIGSFTNKNIRMSPNLTVGYLWGNKNRHNFSLTSLQFNKDHYVANFGIGLKYNYDILLYRKERLSLFISPFIKVNSNFSNFKFANSMNTHINRFQGTTVQLGVSPVIEYKLGKRIDFVCSTPLTAMSLFKGKSTLINNNEKSTNVWSNIQSRPTLSANVGIRINLFRKK